MCDSVNLYDVLDNSKRTCTESSRCDRRIISHLCVLDLSPKHLSDFVTLYSHVGRCEKPMEKLKRLQKLNFFKKNVIL